MDEISSWLQTLECSNQSPSGLDMTSYSSSGMHSSNASDEVSTYSESSHAGGRGAAAFTAHSGNNAGGNFGANNTNVGGSGVDEGKQFGVYDHHGTEHSNPRLAFDKAVLSGESNRVNADMNTNHSLKGWASSSAFNQFDHCMDDSLNCGRKTTTDEYFNNLANISSVWNTPPTHKDDVLPDLYYLAVKIAPATNGETASGPTSNGDHALSTCTTSASTDHELMSSNCCPRVVHTNASATLFSGASHGSPGFVRQDDQMENDRIALSITTGASRSSDQYVSPAIEGKGFVGSPLPLRSLSSSVSCDGSTKTCQTLSSPVVSSFPQCFSSFQSPPVAPLSAGPNFPRSATGNSSSVNRTTSTWSSVNASSVDDLPSREAKHFRRNLNSQWASWPTSTAAANRRPEREESDCSSTRFVCQNPGESTHNPVTQMGSNVLKSNNMFHFDGNVKNTIVSDNPSTCNFRDINDVARPLHANSDSPHSARKSNLTLNKFENIWNSKTNERPQPSSSQSDGYMEQGQRVNFRSPARSEGANNQGLNLSGPAPSSFSPACQTIRTPPSSQIVTPSSLKDATENVDIHLHQQSEMTLLNVLMSLSCQAQLAPCYGDNSTHHNVSSETALTSVPPPHAPYSNSLGAEHRGSAPLNGIPASPWNFAKTPGNQSSNVGREFQEPSNRFVCFPPVNGFNEGPVLSNSTNDCSSAPPPVFGFYNAAVPKPLHLVGGSPWFSPPSKYHNGQGNTSSQMMHHQESDLVSLMRELAVEKQQRQRSSDANMPRWSGAGQLSAGGGYGDLVPSDGGPTTTFIGGGHFAAAVAATTGTSCHQGGSSMAMENPLSCSPPGAGATPYSTPTKGCVFCKNNNYHSTFYKSHVLKDERGHCTCPVLRTYVCPLCRGTGDAAHTLKYCPLNTVTKGDPIAAGLPPGKVTNWRDVANKMPHINCLFEAPWCQGSPLES